MRLLELFSGTKLVSKVARTLEWETVSLDTCPRHSPDLCMDIMDFDESQYPKDYFHFIWASPDCWAYSSARTNAKKSLRRGDGSKRQARRKNARDHRVFWMCILY